MLTGLFAPFAAALLVLLLALVFARLSASETRSRPARELYTVGLRPPRAGWSAGAWTFRAARDRRHLVLLTLLAVAAWIAVVTSLDASR